MTAAAGLLAFAAAVGLATPAAAAGRGVQLRSLDGVALAATLYEAADPSAPGVVLVHMLTRSKDDWRGFAERLQAAGLAALAVDLRGHGGSGGDGRPAPAMAQDVAAAAAFLGGRPGGRRVAVVGASLGASLAVIAAADAPSIREVVLVSPAADYRGVRFDAALRKYGARPMLLVASTEDPYALRTVRALVADASGTREQQLSDVPSHGTALLERDPAAAAAVVDWLRRTLLF
ncbi:MAG: alpha/beta fold hydrolase [Vicinamibacterales bacterium]